MKHIILSGGYTSSVVALEFDELDLTLKVLNESPTGPKPSWIALHPTDRTVLYATNEVDEGMLQSYKVGPDGVLTGPIDEISAGGAGPAHALPLSTGQVAVMNYSGGNGRVVPTVGDPLHFSKDAPVIVFEAPKNAASHPHETVELIGGAEILVPDLGSDKVWRLVEAGSPGEWKIQGFIETPKDAGPRHVKVFENNLYILNELSSTLSAQPLPSTPAGTSDVTASFLITPPNSPPNSVFGAAEILIPPPNKSFDAPYIYVSNRNIGAHDARGDAIAIFRILERASDSVLDGEGSGPGLELVRHVYTGLGHLRGMVFGGEDDGWLVAAGAISGGVAMFKRTEGGANLEAVARCEVEKRTGFAWM